MNWIKTTDSLPDSGERVLVYWLELGDLHQAHVCEYFRKGDIVEDEMPPINGTPNERLTDALFGKRGEKTIEQDGFYIYDSVDDTGLCRWRRHSDVITHWARIVPPEETRQGGTA
jgi:hypothetical protein